jgi:hypothetical protein
LNETLDRNNKVEFLDLWIETLQDGIQTHIYRKTTTTDTTVNHHCIQSCRTKTGLHGINGLPLLEDKDKREISQ